VEVKRLIANQAASYLVTVSTEGKMKRRFLCNKKEGKELNGLIDPGSNALNYFEAENCLFTHTYFGSSADATFSRREPLA
jgi:hypothetical protein